MIQTKRVNNMAIIAIECEDSRYDGIHTSIVDDESWDDILLAIDDYENSDMDIEELIEFIDPIKKAERLEKEAKELREREFAVKLTYEKDERLRKAVRISDISDDFEYDEDGFTYLKGYSIPMPKEVTEALLDARYNPNSNYTVDSLKAFWQWCLLNPNSSARNSLFSWIKEGNFTITDEGLIIAYRCVDIYKRGKDKKFEDFVLEAVAKKSKKRGVGKYNVYKSNGTYHVLEEEVGCADEFKGNLKSLYDDIVNSKTSEDSNTTIYTDHRTRTMRIKIGEPVKMSRSDCDEENEVQCGRGLHAMQKSYGLRYGAETIIILVNPMNIVAIPSYDTRKFRCCEYLPICKAISNDSGDFEAYDSGTYSVEYSNYSLDDLSTMLNSYSLSSLKTKGIVSSEISEDDFESALNNIQNIISSRVVKI